MRSRAGAFSVAAKVVQRSSAKGPSIPKPTALSPRRSPKVRPPRPATFWLKPVAPFRLDLTAWTLRRRPSNLIDRWDGQTYQRVLVFGGRPVDVAVTQRGPPEAPRLFVSLSGSHSAAAEKSSVIRALERLLGLRLDLSGFYELAARDPNLGPLVERFRGVKPPRYPHVFEALANAVACQQISLSAGIVVLSRLTERFGLVAPGGKAHAFPRPEELAGLKPEALRELGFSLQKGRTLIALAQGFCERPSVWEEFEALDNTTAVERLLELRGIGRWSAEYVLLRGLGRLDVYPGDDVGARNNLKRWLRLRKTLDYEGVRRITDRWQPYAGLVYFHMLLDRLAAAGQLESPIGTTPSGGAK